ncbi:hypothetical protein ACFPOI_50910 [Nonomuraea angiospora]|uniref:Uncharacterized protein n=1 Tax=Nonomuraea angiospora TaxID=46172 RepID=A0ABR9M188_9ACTN|nr:hypothetical protein [Nonomuraea angiospora]MBE1586669.1 hypothetical protein [Nonomuraea angiospora]MDX3108861.1 hypothetical protein [Nonomuraea angiospora]
MSESVHIWWDAEGVARGVRVTDWLWPAYNYTIRYDRRGAQVHLEGKVLIGTAGYVAELGCYRFTAVGFQPDHMLSEGRWPTLADAAAGAAHAHARHDTIEMSTMIAVM